MLTGISNENATFREDGTNTYSYTQVIEEVFGTEENSTNGIFYKIADAKNLNIIIPLGVSFFTFNAISYLADVAKGETQSVNFFRILLYLSFFPRLTSGPLQKASEFFLQIENERKITKENLSAGIQIYLLGLFKKLVLADRLLLFVNEVYATPNAFSGASIWLAIISYSLLIYFDLALNSTNFNVLQFSYTLVFKNKLIYALNLINFVITIFLGH